MQGRNLAAAKVGEGDFSAVEARRGLTVKSEGRNVEVSNGPLLIRLIMRDGGYAQEFYGLNSKGEYRLVLTSIHKDLVASSEHRVCASPMIAGGRPHLFAVCRESLRMVFSDLHLHRADESHITIELTGQAQGHTLSMRIALEAESNMVHVSMDDTIPESNPVIEYSMVSFAFLPGGRLFAAGEEPEFAWAPNIRPSDDAVIGDQAFFSPAAIVQHGRYAAAVMPDLDVLRLNRPMPTSLDLDQTNGLLFAPLLSYGFCDYERAAGGRYFRHDITMSRRLSTNRLLYACHLLVDADCKREGARKQVTRFMWDRYGSATPAARSAAVALKTPIRPDARAAYGLWAEGIRTGREELIREARAMRSVVLAAPQSNGLFPTRFDTTVGFWRGCNSTADPDRYSTVECSRQAYWMLKMDKDFEPDARTLPFAKAYAEALVETRLRSGAVPCWYADDGTPASFLRSGAPTAACSIFLAELAKATGLKKHMQALMSSSRFVLTQIIPKGLFANEACASHDATVSLECPDPHTGMQVSSSLAMLWVAGLCLELHKLTGDKPYLTQGLDVLDRLCMAQSLGEKPWMPGSFGLISGGNTSATSDPEASADFALCAMRYGALVGKAEYCQRGAAALRAALAADCDDLTKARIAAVAALVRAEFGSVYVSLSGRWAAELDGYRVDVIESHRSQATVELMRRSETDGNARVVFGGLRCESYELTINGKRLACSRSQMQAGVTIPA